MKKTLLIALIATLGLGGYFFYSKVLKSKSLSFDIHSTLSKGLNFDKWTEFKPKDKTFSISFPIKPTEIKRDIPIPGSDSSLKYCEYQCTTKEDRLFSVSYTTLPASFLKWGDGLVLSGALKLIMSELGKVDLVGKDSNTFKSFPSLDYEHYSSERETAGTLILVGSTLYKVEVSYPLSNREGAHEELGNFVESFEVATSSQTESDTSGKSQSQ